MGGGLIFGLLVAAIMGAPFVIEGSGDAEADSPDSGDTDLGFLGDDEESSGFELDGDGILAGTEGDDTLTRDDLDTSLAEDVEAGAGDDLIDLSAAEGETGLGVVSSIRFDLGDGDDTLTGPIAGTTVSGGAGNDVIDLEEVSGDLSSINGGAGNDTIDLNMTTNVDVDGGEGDDLISGIGRAFGGTGHVIDVNGGDGNDTLSVQAVTDFDEPGALNDNLEVNGGTGTDHFVVALDEGALDADDPTVGDAWDDLETADGTAWRVEAAAFEDFDPATETLELQVESVNDDYTLGSMRIEEEGVIVRYESTGEQLDREILIRMNTEGMTMDQVTVVEV
ncbi:hypothetical protein TRP8649_03892 [Pelagimonas phthalicica]|uniref:Hemolysin-type calcium-binding repeat-containing protein n=1 Tax=Pelagimonas phthalicica TaxID=1037362 RepID=A0A238JH76_9RHOB|nr:hypothetical protein [Pelagimonas phthalicica]TDS89072.1 hypothetical protein CLV87_4261 [Pelagimonas phthalicica]SMX29753.1 hypothetical protein TRP8649_03892 [Pelagimonas phthalicica]